MRAVHMPEEKRFTLLDYRGTAWGEVEYSKKGEVLTIAHTGISPEKQGMGFGDALMLAIVEYARESSLTVRAVCPFARHFFEKNPDCRDVLES